MNRKVFNEIEPLCGGAPDLLTRLREAAGTQAVYFGDTDIESALTIAQVARGLERMRTVETCDPDYHEAGMYLDARCDACWAAMLDAFITGATGEGCKDG